MADGYLINRFLKINGLPIPPQTRAHDTAAFQRAPNPPRQNIVMQPVTVMQHVPPAWSLPDMLTYSDDLDELPTYSYNNHLQLPAPEMNPSMHPTYSDDLDDVFLIDDSVLEEAIRYSIEDFVMHPTMQPVPPLFPAEEHHPNLPEGMFMHVPRAGSPPANTYIQSGLVQLPTYSDDHVQVPSAEMHPAMQPVPPVLFPAENLPNSPENMVMHVPRHSPPADIYMTQRYDTLKRDAVPIQSGLVQLPTHFDHVQLPAAEVHRAMQPVPPAPPELPVPPVPPPPVGSKRGKPWTIEEHKSFLRGLGQYGKGDWRSISRIYVPSKTPTQIASHAQKYFLRQISEKKRKSIHDIVLEDEEPNQALLPHHVDHHTHDHHGGVARVEEEPHQGLPPHHTDHHTEHDGGVVMVQESDQSLLPQLTDTDHQDWVASLFNWIHNCI